MDFLSIRLITSDVPRLVAFYERLTGVPAQWRADVFAELAVGSATVAIADPRTVQMVAPGAVDPAANRSVIVEFFVDDVDARWADLTGWVEDVVAEPATMPWGNRSLLLRDPDGNLVNLFTPVTPAARERFGR